MSRTIRFRKSNHIPWWNNYEWKDWIEITEEEYQTTKYGTRVSHHYWGYRLGNKEGTHCVYEKKVDTKATFWKTHKDQRFFCKEPGPSWFRNLYTERPQRREGKRQLNKFLLDSDFEVLLDSKSHLEYYT